MNEILNSIKAETAATFIGPHITRYHFGGKEDHPDCMQIKKDLRETIVTLYRETAIYQYLSGVSLGIDIWAAETVLDLKKEYPALELYCVVPYSGQADKWSSKNQARYAHILHQSTGVIQISADTYIPGCSRALNVFLVEHAHILIAAFGRECRSKSGSIHRINIARENGNRIIFIN
ncbi:SLOG family protein [Desulforamulus aeronauticus]|uniref:Uncharacterized SPBc2 prophage-derived protein YoqJ n=1 Tax=Desulforamulus aeronauticus DSM 10349 TaxID=1121421 RepID=A0A1M6VU23_9FIRM|nr:SLOG family protein [Desulforamulus aeronauticus]SHK84816.1 Uncharacterized SPBc2 prophage-derived protein YoqJ [Desulforamulus aeronauticus DSM 10349]